jgi:O-antigen/teichoic acid export membrane protein
VILARLLAPNDFGLFGIALLTLSVFDTFSQTGFGDALVQKPGDISKYLDISWTVTIVRGVVLFGLIFFSAPAIAAFFDSTQATLFIRIIALSILLKACNNVGVIYFPKQLTFDKQFTFDLASNLVDFIVAITAALLLRNAWALVFGSLAGNMTRLGLSYHLHPYRPRLQWDWVKIKELLGFGKWIWAATALVFLVNQGDDLVVGRMLGTAALGFYQMAYRIANLTATEIAEVVARVAFPAYARLQDEKNTLRKAFMDTTRLTLFISTLPMILIVLLAADLTAVVLGKKWMPMVPAMQVLALVGLARAVAATTRPVLLAVARPDVETKLKILQLILLAALIVPLSIKWEILGTAIAVLVSAGVMAIASGVAASKLIACHNRHLFTSVIYPLVCTMAVCALHFMVKPYFPGTGGLQIAVSLTIVVGAYLAVAAALDKFFGYGIRTILQKRVFNVMSKQ